ncbi:MAG: hypothetical protein ACYSUB_16820 [Planctomycetota bacterium]|jgi:hypothetical protein
MKTLNELFRSSLAVLTVLLFFHAGAYAQQLVAVDTSFVQELSPTTGIVSIQQVTFVFDAGRVVNTDWGQIQTDPTQWGSITGMDSGYVNLFVYSDTTRTEPNWIVRNLHIPKIIVNNCSPTGGGDSTSPGEPPSSTPPVPSPVGLSPSPTSPDEPPSSTPPVPSPVGLSPSPTSPDEPPSSTPPVPSPGGFDPAIVPNLVSVYFDLRPAIAGSGRLDSILGTVLVSEQPLPEIKDILRTAGSFIPQVIGVQQVIVDAEGDDQALIQPQASIIVAGGPDLIGPPPLPPDPGIDLPGDLLFPIEVFQLAQPNVSSAENQCVPMAHANVLAYLQSRYNGVPLVWNLPHSAIPGIGKTSAAGDVLIWFPEPQNSVVANVDSFTRRLGVNNPSVGGASTRCQNIRGLLGYMTASGDSAQVRFRHRGDELLYGDGLECDNGTVLLGGLVSIREGLYPTWEWIFEQLQLGRGVAMSFGRYDMNGVRTSGHMVRVWGAARYNNKDYIYTLDDGKQGINSFGLRTQQWEVADIGQPGLAGIPDGRLNMNGTSWEIEFAISTEAKPTLAIP